MSASESDIDLDVGEGCHLLLYITTAAVTLSRSPSTSAGVVLRAGQRLDVTG